MNVFTDFHHAGLLNSLIMLFEGRLKGNVYRPIGLEWADEGFWHVFDHPATRQQYLGIKTKPADGTPPLNDVEYEKDGIHYCQDIDSGQLNKAITLEKFKQLPIDIVVASLPQHIEPFKRLITQYKPNAKLIYQIGNAWTAQAGLAPNIMASAIITVPPEINFVEYHQEFDLGIFNHNFKYDLFTISSFLNIPENTADYPLLLELEKFLPEFRFNVHGGMGRNGALHGTRQVAEGIQKAQFVWHVKAGGDGYGHILFNSAACGRPLIVKRSYYEGKLGEKLLIPDKTCIDIDGLTIPQIINKIKIFSNPGEYNRMSQEIYNNFRQKVNFDADFKKIRNFLKDLR